jgi:hypothetical protein
MRESLQLGHFHYRIILPRVKRNFLKLGKPTANDDAADEQGKRTIFLDIAGDET